jgi:ligand-binding SRPBCC domain-containing protein
MPIIRVSTPIQGSASRVFDLARDIGLHEQSMRRHRERAVSGITSGLIGPGEDVTWEARHLGRTWRLTSRITQFEPPRHFRDTMVAGPFRRFDHDHLFEDAGDSTTMLDVFDYEVPYGSVGGLADLIFLRGHLRRVLVARASAIKAAAESPP